MKNQKGFTLIEIIIVVIIMGVLASLALPKLTAQINKSRAAEAYNALGLLVGKAQECYTTESDTFTGKCDSIALISTATGYSWPTSVNFTYAFSCAASTACGGTATASKGTGVITVQVDLTTGAVTKSATADFAGTSK